MNFGVRRHVAAFKARTRPRTPNLSDVDLSWLVVCDALKIRLSPSTKGREIEVRDSER
jgi:hypothetical protein